MSPYLTIRGRWLLLSGMLFILLGALFSSSLILFLGEIQIAVLAVAFMLIVPGALALDRRQVFISVLQADDEGEDGSLEQSFGGPFAPRSCRD